MWPKGTVTRLSQPPGTHSRAHLWSPSVARSWPAWFSRGKVYRCAEAQRKPSRSVRSRMGLGPASQDTSDGWARLPALLLFVHHGS